MAYALSAVIMMTMLGLAAGNYATSIIYRLPRGLKIPNDPPYCDSCRHYLEVRDLFPFFSWVVNRGKCRFCGVRVPALYAIVEWSSVMLFNAAFFQLGLGEPMILVIGLGMFLIILASHYYENQRYYNEILIAVVALAMLHRVLLDHTIYGATQGAYVGLLVALAGWGLAKLSHRGEKLRFPPACLMPVVSGLALGAPRVIDFVLLAAPLYALLKLLDRSEEQLLANAAGVITASISILVLLLFPHCVEIAGLASR